jgi:tripartite motif-containing protein 71
LEGWAVSKKLFMVIALGVLALAAPAGSSAAVSATYLKTFGYSGPAGLYAYGMAWDPTDNSVLVSDYWNYRVQRFSSTGTFQKIIPAKPGNSTAGAVYDIAVDPFDVPATGGANFWMAEQEQGRIIEMTHNGTWLQTIGTLGAGTDAQHPGAAYSLGCGSGKMTWPTHLAIDPSSGKIYVSDPSCDQIWIFSHTGTFLGQFSWTGFTAATGIYKPVPRGIAEDTAGNFYVAELNSHSVAVFDPSGKFVRAFPKVADMGDVRGVDIDTTRGYLYVVGAYRNCVYQFTLAGALVKKWCSVDGTSGGTPMNSIRWPAVDPVTGYVYIGDTWGYRVWAFDPRGAAATPAPLPWSAGPAPPPDGGYNSPNGVAVDPATGSLYVADTFENSAQKFASTSYCLSKLDCPGFRLRFGTRSSIGLLQTGFDYPKAAAFADGYLWIGEADGHDVQAWDTNGNFIHRFGQHGTGVGFFKGGVQGLAVQNGLIYATDTGNCRLQIFDEATALSQPTPQPVAYMGSCGTGVGQMAAPRSPAVTADGNRVYIIETGDARVSVWNTDSSSPGYRTATSFKPSCGGTGLRAPVGMTFDPSRTWLYIADTQNHRVVRVRPDNSACEVVTTGLDTPAKSLAGPRYLTFSPDGSTLYVSDSSRHVYAFTISG